MKALSIRQPYAWLISNGHKDIENRTWPTNFRGQVLIHAGISYPMRDHVDYAEIYGKRFGGYPERAEMIGGIVGIATIIDCVQNSESEWFYGPHGFVMRDARPLPLIPCKGALGFFEPNLDFADKHFLAQQLGNCP